MLALIAATSALVAALHGAPQTPAAQLAEVQRSVPYRVMLLPQSIQLLRAELLHDGPVTGVRLEYSIEGALVDVEERPATPADAKTQNEMQTRFYNIDGYPALYREYGGTYRTLSTLTWYRPDLLIMFASRDRVSAPMFLDLALDLR